jgi:hypothetical protein
MIRAVIDPYPAGNNVFPAEGVTIDPDLHTERPVCAACLGGSRRRPFYLTAAGVHCEACIPGDGHILHGMRLRDNAASSHKARRFNLVVGAAIRHAEDGNPWTPGATPKILAERYHALAPLFPFDVIKPVNDWVLSLTDDATDYEQALALLQHTVYVFPEQFGLAASAHQAYLRAERNRAEREKREAEREANAVGAFVGTVGPTQDIRGVTCTAVLEMGEGDYGTRFLIKFSGPAGEELVWWTGEGTQFDPKVGETYDIRAAVKAHNIYNGVRQTVLTRCKLPKEKT